MSPPVSEAASTRLIVEASPCTEFLPRLLGVVAQQNLIPRALAFSREAEGLRVEVALDNIDDRTLTLMTGRIERIIAVAKVTWCGK